MVSVALNIKKDRYEASFSNLGLTGIPIGEEFPTKYDRLLCGGIWCIVRLEYASEYEPEPELPEFMHKASPQIQTGRQKHKKREFSPITVCSLKPIQMPHIDMEQLREGRKAFTKEEWIDVLLRSSGMEPDEFTYREKWLLLNRMLPLVENNFNFCELGPRSTGKSHLYKEISPNSILVSGGQTTVANLFYNMSSRQIGLVGMWDTVAFDEVAGITFKDKDGIQIMKDYMASGSFARGREEKNASASMVFVGNINQSVESLIKTSHLFDPFPDAMSNDSAFFDRMHYYLPGWEVPKMRPEFFTNDYGFITDYVAEFMREMRKRSFSDSLDKYFKLGNNLNQRDTIAVRKTVSGMMKLIYPNGEYTKEDLEEVLKYALVGRRRVKEQLKKIGGMEFYDVQFSYIDNETLVEEFVSVPEQGGGKIIPEGMNRAGHVYTVARGKNGMIGTYKIETEVINGSGKFEKTGVSSDREAKEAIDTSFKYFRANSKNISGSISVTARDYMMHVQDIGGIGMSSELSLAALVGLCSGAMNRPVQSQLVVLGSLSIGGTINKIEELANVLQVCFDAGAKKILLPMSSAMDIGTVPPELFAKFQTSFYVSPEDAVFKALGAD